MNKLLSFIFTIFLLFTMGCDQNEMPNIGGDIVGPTLSGCEAAYLYDWEDFEFSTSLDGGDNTWIALSLEELTLFTVVIDQPGFLCSIYIGCDGEWGSGDPIFEFETIGSGFEVGIVPEGNYWVNILNTRPGRMDFTFRIETAAIVYGCTNNDAENYNTEANVDDGSCVLQDCTTEYYVENYGEAINDCDGNCSPVSWIGDGWCDDGAYGIYDEDGNVVPINLMCPEFNWDEGDCDAVPGECTTGLIEDCNGICGPESWVGDGFCDDGSYEYNGNPIFFNCVEFNNDEGDCDASFNRQQNQQPKYPNGRIQLGQ